VSSRPPLLRRQGQPQVRQQAFRAPARPGRARLGGGHGSDGLDAPSTRRGIEYLRQAPEGLQIRPLLIVVDDLDSVEARSFRNIPGVYVLGGYELQTVDIVAARGMLVERAVWERLAGAPLEVETVSPAPTRKPAPARTEPAAPPTRSPPAARAEPKRSRSRKAAAAEEPVAEEPVVDRPADRPEPTARADETPAAEADAPDADERRSRDLAGSDIRRSSSRPVISEKSFQLVQAHNQ